MREGIKHQNFKITFKAVRFLFKKPKSSNKDTNSK